MPIPDYQTLMLPVLKALQDGADRSAQAVIDAVSEEFGLSAEERKQLAGSGRIALIASRIHWAMTYLAKAELTSRPSKGVWRITQEGRRVLATNPANIDNTFLSQYAAFREYI